ncbi:MAG TPA: hypothetical protein VM241_09105 [Candidatus Thermoplasmatota archaeon]|nr:hypothetical protein [Candidatus Thermoplasmatota archaeon]
MADAAPVSPWRLVGRPGRSGPVARHYRGIGPWLRGAWWTLRHVDACTHFPAIRPSPGMRLRVRKGPGARITIRGRLFVHGFLDGRIPSIAALGAGARLEVGGDFLLGDNVRLKLEPGAVLEIAGARETPHSGVNTATNIAVVERVTLGPDVTMTANIFVTDSDWHGMGDAPVATVPTVIGAHAWVLDGAKILRGARIGRDSIVAANAVVLEGEHPPNALLAGVPAKAVRTGLPAWRL